MKVGVIGLGLIGGSIAKAWRKQGYTVFGYDTDVRSLGLAIEDGVVEDVRDWTHWLDLVDEVVVATPLATVPGWITALSARPRRRPGIMVEVGSVKGPLMASLYALKAPWSFLSLHPMAGKESRGYASSQAELFGGYACAVIDAHVPTDEDVMQRWMQVLGTRPVVVTADTHDTMVAQVSHLPYLIAAALLYSVGDPSAPSLQLAGSGFRDTTRVGASDPELWQEILVANRRPIQQALNQYSRLLEEFLDALEKGESLPGKDIIAQVRQAILRQ